MGGLDIVIAIVVMVGLWRGFQAGFIRTAIALVSWFIALVAGTRLADDVAPHLSGMVQSPVLQMGLGFLLVVLAVLLIMQIISTIVRSIVAGLKLGLVDQFAGGVLGIAKSLLIVLVILNVSAPLLAKTSLWQSSVLVPELMPFAPFAKEFVSDTLDDAWGQVNTPEN